MGKTFALGCEDGSRAGLYGLAITVAESFHYYVERLIGLVCREDVWPIAIGQA
ncbi:MAG: hypothetical protein O2999_14085 [Nitrospirae bacterium]|nr:hypothetical protein [Nitrospirota bacterium]MDA1305397.1 hypothetical protein [Nitrospirota bacterium]